MLKAAENRWNIDDFDINMIIIERFGGIEAMTPHVPLVYEKFGVPWARRRPSD